MAWTYLNWFGEDDGRDDRQLPPPGTAYLGFDTRRACVVIGFREPGGYSSFLGPNVDDDCDVAAWAPLDEPTDPDLTRITGWDGKPRYPHADVPRLVRHNVAIQGPRSGPAGMES